MNAATTSIDTEAPSEKPAFGRLTELYECLGLNPDQAITAAEADLACGWHVPTSSRSN